LASVVTTAPSPLVLSNSSNGGGEASAPVGTASTTDRRSPCTVSVVVKRPVRAAKLPVYAT
jgi:hypothetical protein